MTDKEKKLQAEAIDYYRKQIADLKKENAELKARVEKQNADILFLKHLTEELEKENVELKAANSEWEKASDKWKNLYNSTNEQLTEAKEIIKTFCGFCSVFNSTNGSFDNLIAKAEQFLKENKK